jgi:hypothetical protein
MTFVVVGDDSVLAQVRKQLENRNGRASRRRQPAIVSAI